MAFFNRTKPEGLPGVIPQTGAPVMNIVHSEKPDKLRPCLVNSRKAVFHCWVHSARPVKPRGMEEDETAERYQLSATHGLVEFEDGTVARVWPQDIQFVDTLEEFESYKWPETLPFTFEETTEDHEEMTNGDH